MPDRTWYYSRGGQQQGPVDTAQLKQLAASGELTANDLVWTDTMTNWAPANTVKGLFPSEGAGETPAASMESETSTATATAEPTAAQAHTASPYGDQLSAAKQMARAASRDAIGAVKSLVTDPVGGLAPCFERLGSNRAMQVGIVLAVASVVLYALAALFGFSNLLPGIESALSVSKLKIFFKVLIAAVVGAAAMIGVSALFRSSMSRAENLRADLFIVGAASLPFALAKFLAGLLVGTNQFVAMIVTIIGIFAGTYALLMLYYGQMSIKRLAERVSALAVACIVSAGAVASGLVLWLMR
jgi:hypothetical protein